MADTKKADTKREVEDEAPIGGPIPESPPVTDVAVDPGPDPYGDAEEVKVPKGAYIEDLTALQNAQASDVNAEPRAPAYSDEYQGQGGRFRINPETGVREPVYEKYIDADGNEKIRKAL